MLLQEMWKGRERKNYFNQVSWKNNNSKAAHHGSEYTMSEETLAKIQPEITWISCGTDNSYGHPHQGFLERINKLNSKMYVTMNDGAITVETDGIHMIIYEKCKQ